MNPDITLHYRDERSDKVYQAAIEPQNGLYVVTFAYGRRGTTLQTGLKTTAPVDRDTAEKVFRKLVTEKKAKGYTEAETGTPYQHSGRTDAGLRPQLLNAIDEAGASRLLSEPGWCAQEKFDGRRMLVKRDGAAIHGINKKGLLTGLPSVLVPQLRALSGDFVLDSEAVGDVLHVFDLLLHDEQTWMLRPYVERLDALRRLIGHGSHLRVVETATGPADKLQLLRRLKARNAEGIVLKDLAAAYTPGRPDTGGSALKLKFTATASLLVAQVNVQRSVGLRLHGQSTGNGNVTIPPHRQVPAVGTVVEVRYLYAFPGSLALFQPVYLGERDDVDPSECTVGQLKFKAAGESDPDEG